MTGPHCFCAGTKLMTLRGEVPVERVAVGDRVVTLSGNGPPLKQVVWTGHVTIDLDRHPDPLAAAPVRLHAGAVEPGMPVRDLRVSPDHGIFLADEAGQGVLVPALYLVNGATITRDPPTGSVTYFHVELEEHDILMADGMAAESYLDTGNRSVFEASVIAFVPRGAAPPAAAPPGFMPAARDRASCVKLVLGADAAPVHARLMAHVQALGHALTHDPALAVTVAGAPAELLSAADGDYIFLLPPGAAAIRLSSRICVPNETDPRGGDARRLGVALARVLHDGAALPLDGPAFGAGFLAAERDGASIWRWTTGDAAMTLTPRAFETTLELHVHTGWSRYWLAPGPDAEISAAAS
ncbi:Hint domain-containing protein [Limobrevibacterium gyesilva]|uniref:Hint domain-containing protein n=1 Tax=Limobrevibacterium gyesilva TaxID=2991712 RepID=A0AA41YU33_9PROT|nr:Hint domain-containing protein [Limobrevibacterium gyesilva]MCW3476588.1 Hint domain-containing protein [Limobrevibacterium gyesilva]